MFILFKFVVLALSCTTCLLTLKIVVIASQRECASVWPKEGEAIKELMLIWLVCFDEHIKKNWLKVMLVRANKLTAGKPSYKQISYQLLCLVSKAKMSQHTSWQRKNIPDVLWFHSLMFPSEFKLLSLIFLNVQKNLKPLLVCLDSHLSAGHEFLMEPAKVSCRDGETQITKTPSGWLGNTTLLICDPAYFT